MNMKSTVKRTWLAPLGLCAALAAGGVVAADDVTIPPSASNDRPAAAVDPMAAPAPQRYDRIDVVNGGVTVDQATTMKRIAPQYRLRVEISGRGGDYYVADRLQLMQRGEVIAEITDAGPWLLFDLPPGRYTLRGDFAGREITREVNVADAGTTLHWVLPSTLN